MSKVQAISRNETFEYQIEDSTFILRRISDDEQARIYEQNKRRQGPDAGSVDLVKFKRALKDRAILDWRDIEITENGVTSNFPCTPENKNALPDQVWTEIQRVIGLANIDDIKAKETSLKN